jgi:hypothetical protein
MEAVKYRTCRICRLPWLEDVFTKLMLDGRVEVICPACAEDCDKRVALYRKKSQGPEE